MTGFNKLSNKDYTKTALRCYYLQNGFNYNDYQGLGYAFTLYPALKKMCGKDKDRLSQELLNNCEFFNTGVHLVPFISSIHLAMLENGIENSEVRNIKMSLMGPLAGIGDALSQFLVMPLFGTICASMAMDGMSIAPILFVLFCNAIFLPIRLLMGAYGRKVGTTMIATMSEKMGSITDAAGIVGVTVIAGLAATFVKMKVHIVFAAGEVAEGAKASTVDIQAMLDKVAPALLPVLYTCFIYYLVKKKNVSTYWLVLMTVIIGVVLSCAGILV